MADIRSMGRLGTPGSMRWMAGRALATKVDSLAGRLSYGKDPGYSGFTEVNPDRTANKPNDHGANAHPIDFDIPS